MSALHGGRRDKLEVSPNLWAGVGLVRGGAGTALVGSAETVAERIREYQALGIDTIVGSGYPHLEEAYKVAELLFPVLKGVQTPRHDTRFEFIGTAGGQAAGATLTRKDAPSAQGEPRLSQLRLPQRAAPVSLAWVRPGFFCKGAAHVNHDFSDVAADNGATADRRTDMPRLRLRALRCFCLSRCLSACCWHGNWQALRG